MYKPQPSPYASCLCAAAICRVSGLGTHHRLAGRRRLAPRGLYRRPCWGVRPLGRRLYCRVLHHRSTQCCRSRLSTAGAATVVAGITTTGAAVTAGATAGSTERVTVRASSNYETETLA